MSIDKNPNVCKFQSIPANRYGLRWNSPAPICLLSRSNRTEVSQFGIAAVVWFYVLEPFWKTSFSSWIRTAEITWISSMFSQLYVVLIHCRHWTLTDIIPAILILLLLLHISVRLLHPDCHYATAMSLRPFSALLFYDYTLTIAREIELFWRRPKWSFGFSLFIANRYLVLLGHAPSLVSSSWSPKTQSDHDVGYCSWLFLHSDVQHHFWYY